MQPLLYMVTDRRRLGPDAVDRLVPRVLAAARAGIHLVQIREPDLEGGPLTELVEHCVRAVASTTTRIIVNDRLDVALAAGAHGVHLRADSMPAARVRRHVPSGFLIGRSIHSPAEAAAASRTDLDYLIFGTVFPTSSKPDREAAGARALADAVVATTVPVLAIGGVTGATAGLVARSGAAGVAAIGLFSDAPQDQLPSIVAAVNQAFVATQ
jgi:thiamine-phosphate pyrophosphorylase